MSEEIKTNEPEKNSWLSEIWKKIVEGVKNWWAKDKEKVIDFVKALLKDLWEAIKEAFKKLLASKKEG